MADPCTCRHPGGMGFPIGLRVVRCKRGDSVIEVAADICMDCGSDRSGQMNLVDGLTAAHDDAVEMLAVPFIKRLDELVRHRRAELGGQLLPLWMAGPLGLNGVQIAEYVRTARAMRAADYMGERMARYAVAEAAGIPVRRIEPSELPARSLSLSREA